MEIIKPDNSYLLEIKMEAKYIKSALLLAVILFLHSFLPKIHAQDNNIQILREG